MVRETPPLAGFLRVVFVLALAALAVTTVVAGVTSLYDAPSSAPDFSGFEEFQGFLEEDDADYNRNVGLILGLIGTPVFALGLLGLGSRHNHLRVGLLIGGVTLVITGVAQFGVNGSDDWLTLVPSGLALAVLVFGGMWLDEGLPIGRPPAVRARFEPPPPPSIPEPPSAPRAE